MKVDLFNHVQIVVAFNQYANATTICLLEWCNSWQHFQCNLFLRHKQSSLLIVLVFFKEGQLLLHIFFATCLLLLLFFTAIKNFFQQNYETFLLVS